MQAHNPDILDFRGNFRLRDRVAQFSYKLGEVAFELVNVFFFKPRNLPS